MTFLNGHSIEKNESLHMVEEKLFEMNMNVQ